MEKQQRITRKEAEEILSKLPENEREDCAVLPDGTVVKMGHAAECRPATQAEIDAENARIAEAE